MCEISLIVSVYNTEQYLPRCIDSILQQTFCDFEIILVDDGTKDNAGDICDEYAGKDSRIRVIHQKNSGLALARKRGLSVARGKYIMFVDSDDWIDKQMLEIMYIQAKKVNADVVCAQFRRVDEEGHILTQNMPFGTIVCENQKEMIYHMHVSRKLSASACTKLISKESMKHIHFPGDLAIGEEHDMVIQLILQTSKLVLMDNVFYNYFIRSNSISHSGYNQKYANSLNNYITIERKLEQLVPEYKTELRGFYAEFEMAVITAMCRNKKFDRDVINQLRYILREYKLDIVSNKTTPLYMKICAVMITYTPRIFIVLFCLLHLFTGR